MDLERLIFLFLVVCESVLGAVIDAKSGSRGYVHCLASMPDVIQITDPFLPSLIDDKNFISMEWYKYSLNGSDEVPLLQFLGAEPKQYVPSKFTSFDFWGLQINNVDLDDSGLYMAKLVALTNGDWWSVEIEVASPPVLASEKLSISQKLNENSVLLSCGQVVSLGSPPVTVMLKAGDGTVLPAVYRDGFVEVTISSEQATAESGKFTCEINMYAPAAKCIDGKDVPRWEGAYTGKIQTAGSDMIGIIAGIVAAVVVIIITIIIIIVFVLKRRKMKSKTYNAKVHETKREEELNQGKSEHLLRDYENPYDKPSITPTPIYKGPNAPSPYMVSKLTQGNEGPDTEYEEMGYGNGDSSPPRPSSGKFSKRGEQKDKRRAEKDRNKENNNGKEGVKKREQNPPKTKPRSIFLTPSMEELDKINTAVAGGEGSGANAGIGTRV